MSPRSPHPQETNNTGILVSAGILNLSYTTNNMMIAEPTHLPLTWEEPQAHCNTERSIYIYISLFSSALRISVVKNLIISTKLSAGMSAKLISNPESKLGRGFSKHTLVGVMVAVRRSEALSSIMMVVPDNVTREVPIVSRIC